MKLPASIALLPLALLAACSGAGTDNASTPTASAPVAAKPAPAGKAWTDVVSATPEGGYRMGNPDAPLKLIEYGSRACPFCAKFSAEGTAPLKAGYIASGKVSYEFRDYPIHGALDVAPYLLGHCLSADAFFPMLDQMMANQPTLLAKVQEVSQSAVALGEPTKVATAFAEGLGYLDFVKQRGVPEDQARACLNDKAK
ncbi:MAG: DsbA family protein, partial [Sphingomonas sp.]|uniref:thioredoxin domain-containing protein n=1 Tax=Sphingomonas sp. TaxID=28214 RepID=UPI0025F25F02